MKHVTPEAPLHWTRTRLRHVVRLNPSKGEIEGLEPDQEVTFLPMEAIGEDGLTRLDATRPLSEVKSGYSYFRDGDVAVARITPCFENGKGALMRDLHGGIGFGTTELIVARPQHDRVCSEYLQWIFQSHEFRRLGEGAMYGAGGQKRVPDDFVRDYRIALPPLPEQKSITTFLDRETGKIDALVEEQRRLIELLKEKRQAVISHAVTKGLDPSARMRPSGVEWLGDVPEHWEVVRVKSIVAGIEQGWSPQCEGYPATGDEWGVLKVGCVNGGTFNPSENKLLPSELAPLPDLGLRKGDVLVSRANTKELVGGAAVIFKDYPRLMICDKLYRLRTLSSRCLPEFLGLFLGTPAARSCIEIQATGASSSMLNIAQATILEMAIPLPPTTEQAEIAKQIALEAGNISHLASHAESAITLLQERRSALISAAVTGKIDVREAATDREDAA